MKMTSVVTDNSNVMTARDAPDTWLKALQVFVRHPNVYIFGGAAIAAVIWRIAEGQWHIGDLLIALFIVLGWPFMEWRLHLSLLHMKPLCFRGKTFYPDVANKHRMHHMEPWRMDLVFLRWYIVFAIPAVFVLANLLFDLAQALTVCVVGFALTVFYEWNHFITHTRVQAKRGWYKRIFLNHRLHHFKNERYWYGFSVPWVDKYYGTSPAANDVQSSDSCKTLGVELSE